MDQKKNVIDVISEMNYSFEDEELDAFEREQYKLIQELNMKRRLLEESREQIDQARNKEYDLNRALDIERRNLQKIKFERDLSLKTLKDMEEEYNTSKTTYIRQKMELELTTNECEKLKEYIRDKDYELYTIKSQKEELDNRHKCHNAFQKEVTEKLSKLNQTVSQTGAALQSLEADNNTLAKIITETVKKGHFINSKAEKITSEYEKVEEQLKKSENTIITITGELHRMRQIQKINELPQIYNNPTSETAEEYENIIKNLRKELEEKCELTSSLLNTLENVNNDQQKLFNCESKAQEEITKLKADNEMLKKQPEKCDAETQVNIIVNNPPEIMPDNQTELIKPVQTN